MGNKLELTWLGKENEIKIEPRILIENKELSNIEQDLETENMLIHGDNLLALKALESKYAGKVKCIYIDPPYNTGSAFEHYDDNLEHSTWLSLIKPRLEILRNLLSDNGSIWISISDDEGHYLKVLCDEVFGRRNFVSTILWKRSESQNNNAKLISTVGEFILCYTKNKSVINFNKTELKQSAIKEYRYMDEKTGRKFRRGTIVDKSRGKNIFNITSPNGLKKEIVSIRTKDFITENDKKGNIYWTKTGTPYLKLFLDESEGQISSNWFDDCGVNEDSSEHLKEIGIKFDFSKPEKLVNKIMKIASNEGDLVLDSFLGSGTTCAVAHKMKRRYIGIEMGDHAYTHCKVRLDKVVDGSDQGGISKSVNWQGGGGYRFYELAPTLINKDDFDEFVINKEYDADMLASAVALHEGFNFEPDSEIFWKQSKGNESSFLFVTTRHLNLAYLDSIKSTMEEGEYLIIACKSFETGLDKLYPNITIKKIPQMLLSRCEFGKDNYNLNIVNPPVYEDEEEENEDE